MLKVKENSIDVIRLNIQNRNDYPKSDYPTLVKYFDDVYKADHGRLVFVKKNS